MCLNHESESGCKYGDKCNFLHTDAVGQPSKKSKKDGVKGRWLVCPILALRESLFCGKMENCDRIAQSSSRRPRCVIGETKGPPQGIIEMRTSGAKSMGSQIRGKNARRIPETGSVRPQGRLGTGRGCSQTQKGVK